MKQLPHSTEHFQGHLSRIIKERMDGLQQAGVQPNEKMLATLRETALKEARDTCIQELAEVRDQNIGVVFMQHKQRMNALRRQSAKERMRIGLPLVVVFAALAWYGFHIDDTTMGVCCTVGAVALLVALLICASVDKPKK